MNTIERHPVLLRREDTALLVIDIQEKIYKVMTNYELLLENVIKLIKGIKVLNIPIFYTDQYPKGFRKDHTANKRWAHRRSNSKIIL